MRLTLCLVATVLAASVSLGAPVLAQLDENDAAASVAERFGVTVLRVVSAQDRGRAVYQVTFMTPGGDFDGAFQVSSVVVDVVTGDLVPQFRHLPSGYDLSGAPVYRSDDQRPDAAESGVVWR